MRSFFNYAKNRFLYSLLKILFILALGCLGFKSIYSAHALTFKNLLNPNNFQNASANVSISNNKVTLTSSSAFGNAYIDITGLESYSNYTISFNYEQQGALTTVRVSPRNSDAPNTELNPVSSSNVSGYISTTFRTSATGSVRIYFYSNFTNNAISSGLVLSNIQLESGSVATDYEEYYTYTEQESGINSITFNSAYMNYIEGIPVNTYSDIAILNIYLGGSKSYARDRCSTNPFFYKDIYLDFSSNFKQGNIYNISFTFESDFLNSPYADYSQAYLLTGGSLIDSHYKDFKATISNYGSTVYTYLYKVDIEFTATADFSMGRVGFTFNTPEISNLNTSSNIGSEGITSACPVISSNLKFTSLNGYYKTSSDNAIIENSNTTKGIWGTLKSVLTNIINLPKNIANSLGTFFTDLGNKIVNLGTTIINGIKDTLISLFIPENDYFTNWLNDFKITLEEKLGFLLYPFELFIDVINRFLNLNDGSGIISIPEVKVPNFDYTIIEEQEYNLKELYETNHIKTIHTIYLYFIDILLVVGLVNLALKKYNSTIGGNA